MKFIIQYKDTLYHNSTTNTWHMAAAYTNTYTIILFLLLFWYIFFKIYEYIIYPAIFEIV